MAVDDTAMTTTHIAMRSARLPMQTHRHFGRQDLNRQDPEPPTR